MPDGREIVYLKGRELLIASVEFSARPRVGNPRLLAEGNFDDEFSIGDDGRIAVIIKEEQSTAAGMELVLNWFTDLEQRLR
jgi:hypothetical protein